MKTVGCSTKDVSTSHQGPLGRDPLVHLLALLAHSLAQQLVTPVPKPLHEELDVAGVELLLPITHGIATQAYPAADIKRLSSVKVPCKRVKAQARRMAQVTKRDPTVAAKHGATEGEERV